MIRYCSAVTRKGQVTIPKEFRDELGIAEGDKVEWSREGNKLVLERAGSVVERTVGVFRHLAEPMNRGKSIEQILAEEDEAVAQAMMEDWLETEKRS